MMDCRRAGGILAGIVWKKGGSVGDEGLLECLSWGAANCGQSLDTSPAHHEMETSAYLKPKHGF